MTSVFEKDLEFIQLLCNPEYLRWLYNNNYFKDSHFIKYLKYLQYFGEPAYSKFLVYPQCIPILEKLLSENILEKLSNEEFYTKLSEDQYFMWKHRK